jgi:hypothetical protein
MHKDTKAYVQSCTLCQAQKSVAPHVHNRQLHPSVVEGPNVRISIDLIGPLPLTADNYKYVLVMMDYFTKWAEAVPLSSKAGEEIADALFKNWYCVYGIPYEIQSDQGKEFCNDVLYRINQRMAIDHKVTTPYYPNANGLVERFNQTLKKSLSMYAEQFPSNWDWYLNSVLWAYRSSLNPQTGFTPYYLMFGRDPREPTDIFEGTIKDIKYDAKQYGIQMTYHLRRAYEIVKKNLLENAKAMKLNWDSKVHRHQTFKPGDEVLVFKPIEHSMSNEAKHSQVWKRKWQGPFTVLRHAHKNNEDIYIIKDQTSAREFTINVNKLRKYNKRQFLDNTADSSDTTAMDSMRSDGSVPVVDRLRDAVTADASDVTIPVRKSPEQPFLMNKARPSLDDETNVIETLSTPKVTKQEQRRVSERLDDISSPDPVIDSLQEYIVERILDHRKKGNKFEYLVKWLNYSNEQNTWEPKDCFNKDSTCISDYWNSVPKSVVPYKDRPRQYRTVRTQPSKKGEIVKT